MTRAVAAIALAMLVAGDVSPAGRHAENEPLRVLFIGNSLTAANNLPARVATLASVTGRDLEQRAVTYAGFSLEDHWSFGSARDVLASQKWDAVIMQQGPSSLPESQVQLRTWASRFADEVRAHGARPGLLTVWPDSTRRAVLGDVIASYRLAAEAAGAELYPAGVAWQAAWRCNLRSSLYSRDGFHPSALGTYEAALVIYGQLFKASVRRAVLAPAGQRPRTARLLQAAAATALGRKLPVGQSCG